MRISDWSSDVCSSDLFAGVGERTREGNDFYHEMEESKVLDKVARVFGQMNEPPGNRLRVALTGLTMAEKFRDEGRDILFFVDNIYRYTLAGTEVSALLGRMPSAVGYQPTLAEEMGKLQERITSTKTGSIRSEEHTSELQSLMRISYAVFCLKKKTTTHKLPTTTHNTQLKYTIIYTIIHKTK